MSEEHTTPTPRLLPFHAENFKWENFETFCGLYMATGTSLPFCPGTIDESKIRLRIVDPNKVGKSGEKQRGIDYVAKMEDGAIWVLQCKHVKHFTEAKAKAAIKKAEKEYGSRYSPSHYLLWTTGTVAAEVTMALHAKHPNWTIWDCERLTNEVKLHLPPRLALKVIANSFGQACVKDFFPVPDDVLLNAREYLAQRSDQASPFHHGTPIVAHTKLLKQLEEFACGGPGIKAFIVVAAGGKGKTRLIREVAERLTREVPQRAVFFINPAKADNAELPRAEDWSQTTVFHDDAHRLETLPGLLTRQMSQDTAPGSRLLLATRPGASVNLLRQRLIEAGYASKNIITKELDVLTRSEMTQLAEACLGPQYARLAPKLASLSGGCALITQVGGELIRRGELPHLDLLQSQTFREQVFTRFEGERLKHISDAFAASNLERLLRCIALLSPYGRQDADLAKDLAEFLGVLPGQLDNACDSLQASGLLVATQKGLRITPDLFGDHLVYSACYDEEGHLKPSGRAFLDAFSAKHGHTILANLAEAQWRAHQQFGSSAASVIAPVWGSYLEDFKQASYWDKSQMLGRWATVAAYLPAETIKLAEWTLVPTTNPIRQPSSDIGFWRNRQDAVLAKMNSHEYALVRLPALLTPVAIWSDACRQRALELLWQLSSDFPDLERPNNADRYDVFAEVAEFQHNFPTAPTGVLDWLADMLGNNECAAQIDQPSSFLATVLRPFFAVSMSRAYMTDHESFTHETRPIPVTPTTRAMRQRVLDLLTQLVIPRNTVAAINALPVLTNAIPQVTAGVNVSPTWARVWQAETGGLLEVIGTIASLHSHPLLALSVRQQLSWHIIYGQEGQTRQRSANIVAALPDSFELRLARLTLTWRQDDCLMPYDANNQAAWQAQQESKWAELMEGVVAELLQCSPTAASLHDELIAWAKTCFTHGVSPHWHALLYHIAEHDQALSFALLNQIHSKPETALDDCATQCLRWSAETASASIEVEEAILRGLHSARPTLSVNALSALQNRKQFHTERIASAVIELAKESDAKLLPSLFSLVEATITDPWATAFLPTLLQRELTDDQVAELAGKVWRRVHHRPQILAEPLLHLLLDRLTALDHLPEAHQDHGCLQNLARRFPRRMFDHAVRRIEHEESLSEDDATGFQAIPHYWPISLQGLETEPDFPTLAEDLVKRILAREPQRRWPWIDLFRIAVSRTSTTIESLLLRLLPAINCLKDLSSIASMLGFDGSTLVFDYPRLTESLLKKAKRLSPDALEKITLQLIRGAGPTLREWTGSELAPENHYLKIKAGEAILSPHANPTLRAFFERIIANEVDWETSHQRDYERRDIDDW